MTSWDDAQPAAHGIASSTNGRLLLIVGSAVAAYAAAVAIAVVPFGRSFWDFLFLLDGAYRISLGQVPHVDFVSPIGSLTLYLTFWAEWLFPMGQPFIGLHVLMWLVLMPPLAMLAERFETSLGFAAAFALLAAMVLLPFTLDHTSLTEISYFAVYNRFASAGLFLLGLWYVLPKRRWDAVFITYVVTVLIFLKVTAAVMAIGVIIAAPILRRAPWPSVMLGLVGVAMMCGLIQLTNGLPLAYGRDVVAMAALNRDGSVYALTVTAFHNWAPLAVGAWIVSLAIRSAADGKPTWRAMASRLWQGERFATDAVVLLGAAWVAESQNTGGAGLIAAAALLFHPEVSLQRAHRLVGSCLLGAALLLPLLDVAIYRTVTGINREHVGSTAHDFSSLIRGTRLPEPTEAGASLMRSLYHERLQALSAAQAKRFNIDNDPATTSPSAYAAWAEDVVDAAAVFREKDLGATAHRYAAIAFVDPFVRLLHLTPARGVPLVMDIRRTVPLVLDLPMASRSFADADGLFVSTCALPYGDRPTLQTVFQPMLDAAFQRVPLNACWDFYRRRSDDRGATATSTGHDS